RAVLTDDAHAIAGDARAHHGAESLASAEGDADLEHAVAVVLRAQRPDTADAAQRKLEPVPVIGRWERCDHEVDLTRCRRCARRRDRRRPRLRLVVGGKLDASQLAWCGERLVAA